MNARRRPTHDAVKEFLRNAPSRSLDMLRVMRGLGERPSFDAIGLEFGVDKRSVASALKKLNEHYGRLTGGGLLFTRPARNYVLTDAGEAIADELIEAHDKVIAVVRGSANKHREAWVPVTTECIEHLATLKARLQFSERDIVVHPNPHRSADLQPKTVDHDRRRRVVREKAFAFYSACVDSSQLTQGGVSTIKGSDGPMQVIVIAQNPFRVLAGARQFPGAEVAVADLWALDGGLIVPEAGAVCGLLDHIEPGWERFRPILRSTDRETGLACLSTPDLVKSPALIVHGTGEAPSGMKLYDLKDRPELVAVTGFFRRQDLVERLSPTKRDMWEAIWEAAADEWIAPSSDRASAP